MQGALRIFLDVTLGFCSNVAVAWIGAMVVASIISTAAFFNLFGP